MNYGNFQDVQWGLLIHRDSTGKALFFALVGVSKTAPTQFMQSDQQVILGHTEPSGTRLSMWNFRIGDVCLC